MDVFQTKLNEIGADFPEWFVKNLDRLIVTMHPRYKRKAVKAKAAKAKANGLSGEGLTEGEKDLRTRKFPGLSMPDQEWRPAEAYLDERSTKETASDKLPDSISMDNTMAELAAVASRRNRPAAEDSFGGEPPSKRSRNEPGGYAGDSGYEGMRRHRAGERDFGGREEDTTRGRPGRSGPDDQPVLYKIYHATVTNVRDFGAFASIEGIRGRVEGELDAPSHPCQVTADKAGLIHVSNLTGQRVNSATDVIKRNERVQVKVMSIAGTKIGLSVKDVDQRTGADLS